MHKFGRECLNAKANKHIKGAVTLYNFSCNLSRNALHSVTFLETAENVARQVVKTVAGSKTRFHFLQRCRATFRFVAQSHEPVTKCERLCNVSCNLTRNALRDKLHEKL